MPAIAQRSYLSVAANIALAVFAAATADTAAADAVTLGREIAFDPIKGNCLACHQMDDGESPGDLGPPLVAMKARFPDRYVLRETLWDPMKTNPGSRMPPFGRHRILTEAEIDMVVEYLYTL